MPFLNNNEKPSFLNKSTPNIFPKSQLGPKSNPGKALDRLHQNPDHGKDIPMPRVLPTQKEESLFAGKSQISRYEFERLLEKNPKIRQKLAKELKAGLYSSQMAAEIKKIKSRIPQRFGSFINKAEAARAIFEEDWNQKYDIKEKSKKGLDTKEIKEIRTRGKEEEFLKKILGIK